MSDMLLSHQLSDGTRGVVLHSNGPRPTRTVDLGDYLFEATLSRSWPAKTLLTDDGAMIIVQSNRNEFYIAGTGLTVSFFRNPDVDTAVSGIESIEEVSRSTAAAQWRPNQSGAATVNAGSPSPRVSGRPLRNTQDPRSLTEDLLSIHVRPASKRSARITPMQNRSRLA